MSVRLIAHVLIKHDNRYLLIKRSDIKRGEKMCIRPTGISLEEVLNILNYLKKRLSGSVWKKRGKRLL